MTRRRAFKFPAGLALLALAFAPASCRGCGCVEGSKTYETLDGKVKVSLVRDVKWAGGKIPGPLTEFHLHVETTPPFDERVTCSHVDMAEDKEGKLVAYRCQGVKDEPWTMLHLRGADRRVRECRSPVGTKSKPDFDKVAKLDDRAVADRVLDCGGQNFDLAYQMKELVRAAQEDGGSAGAVKLVAALASRPLSDPWDGGNEVLSKDDQAKVRALLCASLSSATAAAPPETYVRAAMRCPLDVLSVADGAMTMFRTQVSDPNPYPSADGGVATSVGDAEQRNSSVLSAKLRALYWSAMIASEKKPAEAGSLACTAVTNPKDQHTVDDRRGAILATVIGRTKTKCEGAHFIGNGTCSEGLDCSDAGAAGAAAKNPPLCTQDDLAALLSRPWKAAVTSPEPKLGDPPRSEPILPDTMHAYLYAAYAGGSLPKEVALPNARRKYPLVAGGAAAPSCKSDALAIGDACTCAEFVSAGVCNVKADVATFSYGYCDVHIDDAHKQFNNVKRTCRAANSECDIIRKPCCPGLVCGEGYKCVAAAPARDARAD